MTYETCILKFTEQLKATGHWNLKVKLPCNFLWDAFTDANPTAQALADKFEEAEGYELSERQCSIAVACLLQEAGIGIKQAWG